MNDTEKKERLQTHLSQKTLEKINKHLKTANCRSKSEFVEKAITFYSEFLDAEDSSAFLPSLINDTMKANLDVALKGVQRNLFKNSVETATLALIMSAAVNASDEQIEKYRRLAYSTVKRNNGMISTASLFRLAGSEADAEFEAEE